MVKFENVSADKNHVGWFQISASLGNHACQHAVLDRNQDGNPWDTETNNPPAKSATVFTDMSKLPSGLQAR